jgi:hypothetical protein
VSIMVVILKSSMLAVVAFGMSESIVITLTRPPSLHTSVKKG